LKKFLHIKGIRILLTTIKENTKIWSEKLNRRKCRE